MGTYDDESNVVESLRRIQKLFQDNHIHQEPEMVGALQRLVEKTPAPLFARALTSYLVKLLWEFDKKEEGKR